MSVYVMPTYSGDWRCLKCGEHVADEQIALPDECPECGCVDFGLLSQSASSCERRGNDG